jgi:predicted DCC family thiol-disulfide oxidoreductase YuxK
MSNSTAKSWEIELLYDGECPLCLREVNFLKKRDAGRGLVQFVDIAGGDYSPDEHGGIDYETAMGRIHAILPDGTIVKNVAVFRRVYEILGIGWIYAVTKISIAGWLADRIYEIWADLRLLLTGRPNLATLVAQRRKRLEDKASGRCRLKTLKG